MTLLIMASLYLNKYICYFLLSKSFFTWGCFVLLSFARVQQVLKLIHSPSQVLVNLFAHFLCEVGDK